MWAMSVFGLQQMVNMMNLRDGFREATDSFNEVSSCAADTLGGTLRSVYSAGDKLQAGIVDLFITPLTIFDPNRLARAGATAARQAANATQQAAQTVADATGEAARATGEAARATADAASRATADAASRVTGFTTRRMRTPD
jgi:hypothetical protein